MRDRHRPRHHPHRGEGLDRGSPARVSFTSGGTVTEQPGWMLCTVIDVHGTKLISSEVFWPTSTNTSAAGVAGATRGGGIGNAVWHR